MTVKWADGLGAGAYREAATRRPSVITVLPTRRGLHATGGAGLGGATGALVLLEYGLTHARALATLGGVSLAVIAGLLLDRIAPRLLNRTELRFTDEALEVRVRPLGDLRVTRFLYGDLAGVEVEEVVDPMASTPVLLHQLNGRRADGSVEPIVTAIDGADTAAWLRSVLVHHALR